MKRKNRRTNRTVQNTRPVATAAKTEVATAAENEIEELKEETIEKVVKEESFVTEEPAVKDHPTAKNEPVTAVKEEAKETLSETKEPEIVPEPVKSRRAAKKETAAEETIKKTTARRTKKTTLHHYVQFAGYEVSADELDEKIKADYTAKTGAAVSGEICVYIKPEEGVAYYSVNGEGSPEFKVNLQ